MSDMMMTHEGTLLPAQEKTYVHLPFDVPEHARQIQVQYSYNAKIGSNPLLTGGNTIDLGVFDERGIDFLSAGFRGWSGSERTTFFINEEKATPGYLAGPLNPGRWHVLLGLYKIAPEGCAYRVQINIHTSELSPSPLSPLPAVTRPDEQVRGPYGGQSGWQCGEFHCHSWHSDGDRSATEVVKLARSRGLDFLAISDHNTIASQRELEQLRDPGLVLIRGVEVTTFKGHFNVWGIPDWVDFRVQRAEDMEAALRFANARGAVTSCGHPKPFGPPWEYEAVTNFDCVEVWNGPWSLLNEMALEYWKTLIATGRRVTAIAGSDWHRQQQLEEDPSRAPGTPAVYVYVPGAPDPSAILDAVRHGHVSLSAAPDAPFLDLRAGPDFVAMGGDPVRRPASAQLAIRVGCQRGAGHMLRLLDQDRVLYEQTIPGRDEPVVVELSTADSLYVRAELRNPEDELKAMTNPVYLIDFPPVE